MQTFIPSYDLDVVASTLDNKRLFKQVVETMQLYNSLTVPSYGWTSHPASVMWQGCEYALLVYGWRMLTECYARGIEATASGIWYAQHIPDPDVRWPIWWGDDAVAASHRSNLLRKDPIHYGQFGWAEPDDLPYVWPLPEERKLWLS